MSDVGLLLDDFGYAKPVVVVRREVEDFYLSNYKRFGYSVFKDKSLFNPSCFVNGSCKWRVASDFSLCRDCGFKFQSRLADVRFNTLVFGASKERVKRRFPVDSDGVSVRKREKGEVGLFE